jgi:TadE-like protein
VPYGDGDGEPMTVSRLTHRWRKARRGQALVEMAVVLPIFFLLLFGLVDLGRAVFVYSSLAEGSREGARWGSVQARAFNDTTRDSIETYVVELLDGVPSPSVTADCTPRGGLSGCTALDVLSVKAEADVEMITPLLGALIGPLHLEARAEVVVNN